MDLKCLEFFTKRFYVRSHFASTCKVSNVKKTIQQQILSIGDIYLQQIHDICVPFNYICNTIIGAVLKYTDEHLIKAINAIYATNY